MSCHSYLWQLRWSFFVNSSYFVHLAIARVLIRQMKWNSFTKEGRCVEITFVAADSQNKWGAKFYGHELAVRKSNCAATPVTHRALFYTVPLSSPTLVSSIHKGPIARLRVGAAKQKMMVNVTLLCKRTGDSRLELGRHKQSTVWWSCSCFSFKLKSLIVND